MGKARFFKIVWSCIILLLVLFITGCGGGGGGNSSAKPEELVTINVTGKIVDSSNKPISGATVTITSDPVVVTTNQWGEFSAKVLPGEHTITVTNGNQTLYRGTFSAQEGSHIVLGTIAPNYPDSTGDTQSPTIPSSATATAASSTQINLNWSPSTDNAGVTAYRIYRNGTQLPNTVTDTTFSDTGLSGSTQYCYTVSAGDAKGNWSAQCVQICATTLAAGSTGDTQAPTIPGSVTATAASLSQINLSWSASTDNVGVTGYKLYRGGVFLKQVTGTSTTETGLSASTQYCYTVSACDAAGNWSGQSTQSCATTLADSQAPNIPGSVTATAVSSNQINLSWSASTDNVGVTAYELYRGGILLKQVTGTSTIDTGLSASTQYCYTVRARDAAANWSAQSTQGAQSCATTLVPDTQAPTVPGSVTATAASSNQINLSWSASTDNVGVTAYELYRGGILLKQVTGTSTIDIGLSASTQYCYTVRARDAAANWSAQSTQGAQSCATTKSTPLTVISVSPTSNAFNVATNAPISATFSESIDPSTATGLNFAVSVGTSGILIPGNVTSNGATVVFTPIPNLAYGTSYRVTIRSGASGIKDLAGNAISSNYSWSFTTVYNQLYDLFMQFIVQPTDANYNTLMNAIGALGTTQEACLYKALGELMDIYRSPVAARMMQDFGGFTVGLDTDFEQLSTQYTPEVLHAMVYNYLKLKLQGETQHRYLINYENLLTEMEQRLTRVDNLLAQADGINLTVSIDQAESVKFDSIDIKVLRAMTNILKANFIYLQSIDLDIKNYEVTYNGSSRDIRDLMNEAVYDDTQSEVIIRELCTKAANVNLFTYSDRSKLTAFRNTLANAFGYYSDAVTTIQGFTAEENEARFLNAFSLDSSYSLELAKSVRDYTMPSILNCIDSNNPLVEFISPRSQQTGTEYVDGQDGFYYLQDYYDIFLDHYRFDTSNILYGIKVYDLLNVNGSKTLRDMAIEGDNFVKNTPHGTIYMPYRLSSTVYYLTGVVDRIWDEFLEEEEVPVATISINGLSSDWINVPVFGTVGNSTIKIARDATNNNVYLYIGSTYTPPANGTYWNWNTSFSIYMDYGDYDFSNYDWFYISCTMSGSSSYNPTYTHSVYSWGQQVGTVVPSAIMHFSDRLGLEMRVDNILPTLLKRGSGNFFYASEYDSARGSYLTSDRDIKLLPEMP